MITNDEKTIWYMDLTGISPHCLASGHEYLLVGYNNNDNAILVEPLKNAKQRLLQTDGMISTSNSQHQEFNHTLMS